LSTESITSLAVAVLEVGLDLVEVEVVDFLSPLPERATAPPIPVIPAAVPPIIFFLVPTDFFILSSSLSPAFLFLLSLASLSFLNLAPVASLKSFVPFLVSAKGFF